MGRRNDVHRITQAVSKAGGTVERTRRGHLRITGPAGVAVVGSALDSPRAWRNVTAAVRRYAGLNVNA